MQPLTNDATTALMRGICDRFGKDARPVFKEMRSRSWASVTFTGARHEIALRLDGNGAAAAADRFLAGLEAAEFRLRGHILADIALVARDTMPEGGVWIRIEALTVEDA